MGSNYATPSDLASVEGLSAIYDFIVIGGGTAGLVVATRLSLNPAVSVLVIEAGANRVDDPMILIPGLAGALYDNPIYDWEFKTVPQKHLSPPTRQIAHPRGKTLGGTSAIYQNKITYNSVSGFDAWEKLGNPGWNWTSMKPYLCRFHTYEPPTGAVETEIFAHCRVDEHLDGEDGPIITAFDGWGPTDTAFYRAISTISKENAYNERFVGGFASPASIDPVTKTRSYAGNSYYNPEVAARSNLRVVTEAVVQKIRLDEGPEVVASGVLFVSKSGESILVRASKEVILCAGSFGSPQLLELSGIGSPELLESHGIKVVVQNPNVGENLQDHGVASISVEVVDGEPTADVIGRDPAIFPALLAMYQQDRSGPLSSFFTVSAYMPTPGEPLWGPAGSEALSAIMALKPKDLSTHPNSAEFEAVLCDIFSQPDGSSGHYFKAPCQFHMADSESTITSIRTSKHPENFMTLFCAANFMFSRGNVHITSSSPSAKPAVDPKYLSHPLDVEIMSRHIIWLYKLIHTAPFSKYFKPGGVALPDLWPGDREPTMPEAEEIVRQRYMSNFHPMGTCAMLPREKGGVVDGRLRVYGVRGLRVVDASVFPLATRGNPISSVYAVAERAVDIIKEDWEMI